MVNCEFTINLFDNNSDYAKHHSLPCIWMMEDLGKYGGKLKKMLFYTDQLYQWQNETWWKRNVFKICLLVLQYSSELNFSNLFTCNR